MEFVRFMTRWLVLAGLLLGQGVHTAHAGEARIDSVNALGRAYIFSNIDVSIVLYRGLANEARELGYARGEGQALQNLGVAYTLSGNHDLATEAHLECIRIFERSGMTRELALAFGDFGYQMKRRDLPGAIVEMRQGIVIAEREDYRVVLCSLYDNYGVLQEMNAEPDSAAYYYRRALEFKTAFDDSMGIPFSLNNLASIHAARGEFAAADSLLTRSDAYRQNPLDTYGRLLNNVHWADLNQARGDLEEAERRYRECLTMPGAADQSYLLIHCYEQLAAVYEQRQDYRRAYESQRRFAAYRDSLVTVETNERIASLEIEFETEKKDREIAENKLAIAARTRQVLVLGIGLILVAALGGGFARYQHLKRTQLKREMELRAQLRRAEYEQSMADEKLRIARELHDNIGAQLTFLISSLDNLAHGVGAEDLPGRLDDISAFGRTTLDELRQTVWAMKHEGEGLDALVQKLHELKRQCSSAGQTLDLDIRREADSSPSLSSPRMLNLYRIVQEAVQNAMKHTEAARIVVLLETEGDGLTLVIADDGPGFREAAVDHVGGLVHMRERCAEVGGELELESNSSGTKITCRLPPE